MHFLPRWLMTGTDEGKLYSTSERFPFNQYPDEPITLGVTSPVSAVLRSIYVNVTKVDEEAVSPGATVPIAARLTSRTIRKTFSDVEAVSPQPSTPISAVLRLTRIVAPVQLDEEAISSGTTLPVAGLFRRVNIRITESDAEAISTMCTPVSARLTKI